MEFEFLKGKVVSGSRYMTQQEANEYGWYHRPLVIVFEGGDILIPTADDECNSGGAMLYMHKQRSGYTEELIPTMR